MRRTRSTSIVETFLKKIKADLKRLRNHRRLVILQNSGMMAVCMCPVLMKKQVNFTQKDCVTGQCKVNTCFQLETDVTYISETKLEAIAIDKNLTDE